MIPHASPPRFRRWLLMALAMLATLPCMAKIQFDVFPGHDGVARAGGWFPVLIEVFNDGPGFDAIIEVGQAQIGGTPQRMAVELPTNTRKRLLFNCFSTSHGLLTLDARLLDKSGKVRAENMGQRLAQVAWENFILGAAPQSYAGMPSFPEVASKGSDFQPRVTRLSVGQGLETFPDNPITLESLNAIYLNSSRAIELKEPQADALLAWVHAGGHLVVAVDQPGDVSATAWLRDVLPVTVQGSANASVGGAITRWLKQSDPRPGSGNLAFALQPPPISQQGANGGQPSPYDSLKLDASLTSTAQSPVVGFAPRQGQAVVSADNRPLIVSGPKGRGLVTAIAFNPEREPFKSWKDKTWFWAKVAGIPDNLLRKPDINVWGGRAIDAVFGAMIETRQVRKLPVGVLLLLLLVYLLVIGPIDRWWLKKINRPMLTWVTFPAYVLLFSVLIYYIGFRLRAGSSEWTELHVVDIYPRSGDALLRGRTFASVYSPANDVYPMSIKADAAHFRTEFLGVAGNAAMGNRARVRVEAKGFDADLEVPVWTSMLAVGDWVASGQPPVEARLDGPNLVLANRRDATLTNVVVVHDQKALTIPSLAGGETLRIDLAVARAQDDSINVSDLTRDWSATFNAVANSRGDVFGGQGQEHIDNWPGASVAASLTQRVSGNDDGQRHFVWPPGFDLSPMVDRGEVLVMAFARNDSVLPGVNRFRAVQQSRHTLYRLVLNRARNTRP